MPTKLEDDLMNISYAIFGFIVGVGGAAMLIDANYDSFYEDWVNPDEYKISIGPIDMPECSTDITLSIWERMNELEVWHWVSACVTVKSLER